MDDFADALSAELIARDLPTRFVGQRTVYLDDVSSTNDVAKELARTGAPEGTLVIGNAQSAGRGRMGRAWVAPAGSSILMSLILRPTLAPPQLARVTIAVALGAQTAIYAETGLAVRLKWPNDLVIRGKKCAGILAEANLVGEHVDEVIVGLGLNVNLAAHSVAEMPASATSLADELGHPIPRLPLLRTMLTCIEGYYNKMQAGASLVDEWAASLVTLQQTVRAQTPGGIETGVATGVDADGALLVKRPDGSIVRLLAADVTLAHS